MAEAAGWRGIDELAALVGHYGWLEARLFELTGRWATAPAGDGAAPDGRADELRVWCAAASRRHGELAAHWAQRLPVRAGVDAGALVVAPVGGAGRGAGCPGGGGGTGGRGGRAGRDRPAPGGGGLPAARAPGPSLSARRRSWRS